MTHGKSLGPRIRELIAVVSYSTLRKWVRAMEATPATGCRVKSVKAGRPGLGAKRLCSDKSGIVPLEQSAHSHRERVLGYIPASGTIGRNQSKTSRRFIVATFLYNEPSGEY